MKCLVKKLLMAIGIDDKRCRIVYRRPIRANLVVHIVLMVYGLKLFGAAGEKQPLMQHAMLDGPVLYHRDASRDGIGIDSNQLDLTGRRSTQVSFGIIQNLS